MIKIAGMHKAEFKIIDCFKSAYILTWRELPYLCKAGLMPLLLQAIMLVYVHYMHPDAGVIEKFLWGFPSTIALAWFIFIVSRLVLFGERLGEMPADPAFRAERELSMRAAMIVSILFNMGTTAWGASVLWLVKSGPEGTSTVKTAGVMLLIGAMFWAIRLGALPAVAAAGYSMRNFIFKVNGAMFSLRVLGLSLLTLSPVIFAFNTIAEIAFGPGKPSGTAEIVLLCMGSMMSVIGACVTNAALAYAVREIIARKDKR